MWHVKYWKTSAKVVKIVSACLGLSIVLFAYPYLVAEIAARNRPTGWSSDLGHLTFQEIYKAIGPPQASMSAKDYQDWENQHWWGVEVLKVVSDNCCVLQSRPSDIQYVVYVKGKSSPARREYIYERTFR